MKILFVLNETPYGNEPTYNTLTARRLTGDIFRGDRRGTASMQSTHEGLGLPLAYTPTFEASTARSIRRVMQRVHQR